MRAHIQGAKIEKTFSFYVKFQKLSGKSDSFLLPL
jgi:hypothetical protein